MSEPDAADLWQRIWGAQLWAKMNWGTPLVEELAANLRRLKPKPGEMPTLECINALVLLEQNLPDDGLLAAWEARTGKPAPKNWYQLRQQAAAAGIDPDFLLRGKWTPGGLLDVVFGALEGKHAKPVKATSPETEPAADKSPRPPREPSAKAFQAWSVRSLLGITNQTEIAEEMTRRGSPASQGQVSKWLGQVEKYLTAGGLLPDYESGGKPDAVAPGVIDMGAPQEHRTPRQRRRRDPDANSDG